jgi:hypothetical protein
MKNLSRVLPQPSITITTLGRESEVVARRHRAAGRFSKSIVHSHTAGLSVHTGQDKNPQLLHAHEVSKLSSYSCSFSYLHGCPEGKVII